jgi:hypothetical protein
MLTYGCETSAKGKQFVIYAFLRSRDRFPVVLLDFSVTYFLPTVPWPWDRLNP